MESYGIGLFGQIPVRESIMHTSEMVSELLFGEGFVIDDRYQHWLKIRTLFDNYHGWIDSRQVMLLENEPPRSNIFTGTHDAVIERSTDYARFRVGMGCPLPNYAEGKFKMGKITFRYEGRVKQGTGNTSGALDTAQSFINTPYLWGGKSSFGIDCSGFTQAVFRMNGVALPRDAAQQSTVGVAVNFISEAQPADLFFFDNENDEITHVGIYLGHNRIIHSSGFVRTANVDGEGILRQDGKGYTHHLRVIKRIM
jgi:cell wall-associated NlpC family hydrolase